MLTPIAIQVMGGINLEAEVQNSSRGVEIVRLRLTRGSEVLGECHASQRVSFCDVGLLWRIRGVVHEFHPEVQVVWAEYGFVPPRTGAVP